jgi:hypothetical protein
MQGHFSRNVNGASSLRRYQSFRYNLSPLFATLYSRAKNVSAPRIRIQLRAARLFEKETCEQDSFQAGIHRVEPGEIMAPKAAKQRVRFCRRTRKRLADYPCRTWFVTSHWTQIVRVDGMKPFVETTAWFPAIPVTPPPASKRRLDKRREKKVKETKRKQS